MRLDDWIEWAVCARPLAGEAVSGDVEVAAPCAGGVLLGAIDGLGHGPHAAEAANRARDVLLRAPADPLDTLVARCHDEMRHTRGAALALAFICRDGRLRWLGVGNVEAVVSHAAADGRRARQSVMLLPGVVGQQIPRLRLAEVALSPGDMLVIATDGIRSMFLEALSSVDTPERTAQRILAEYGKTTDDALVLAAAYLRSGT